MTKIEPLPPAAIKRTLFGIHRWPLAGGGDLAFHEAGHVVVGLALGMPVYDARLAPDGAAGRAGVLSAVGETVATPDTLPAPEDVAGMYRQAAQLVFPGMSPAGAALNFAVMLLAGAQSELIAAGIRLSGELRAHDQDHQQARVLLAATEQRLAMTYAQRMARHLLTSAWADVESIAADLRATGTWTSSAAWVRQSSYPSTTGYSENAN